MPLESENIANNVPMIYVYEVFYGNSLTGYGKKQMLQPEVKSVATMKGIVWTFS